MSKEAPKFQSHQLPQLPPYLIPREYRSLESGHQLFIQSLKDSGSVIHTTDERLVPIIPLHRLDYVPGTGTPVSSVVAGTSAYKTFQIEDRRLGEFNFSIRGTETNLISLDQIRHTSLSLPEKLQFIADHGAEFIISLGPTINLTGSLLK